MSKEEKAREARRKAKEYVKGELSATFDDVVNHFADKIFSSHELEVAFIYGYNSRSTEVDMLREALGHLVNLCDADSADEVIFYQMEHNVDLDSILKQAKSLLKNNQ